MATKKTILVYSNWEHFKDPVWMGTLSVIPSKGKETFSFEYAKEWLTLGFSQLIDPDLQLYTGPQYLQEEKRNFGIFLDSSPDRWGETLMKRREAMLARKEERKAKTLLPSDYLLGVFDAHRMGALRFKESIEGVFLNDNREMATPPWTSLRALENASLKFEQDKTDDPDYLKWLNMLLAPGSSLGGARPKASVVDEKGRLWIAKFPSVNDDKNVGAWEMVVNELAVKAGLNVAEGTLKKFNSKYHTYLTKRFDRTKKGDRIHFASAMTLLGYTDGKGAEGASYLQLAEFLIKNGANVTEDLKELWRRIVFNICVKNTDDHLRNHGFILIENGWILSPAYDINPVEYGVGLSLNISEEDNSLDLDLALSIIGYFRLTKAQAQKMIEQIIKAINNWKSVAKKYDIPKAEQNRMASAFYGK
jgi:serine/threonine-protein kinase HipA